MKQLFYLSLFFCFLIACDSEDDDDGQIQLNYTQCDAEHTFSFNDKLEETLLEASDVPISIRSYIAGEFPGFEILEAYSFRTQQGDSFTEVSVSGNGFLLFDSEGTFICATGLVAMGGYDDDDEGYEDDDA